MIVQALASEPHYREHLTPILDALPPGEWLLTRNPRALDPKRPVLVASYKDYRAAAGREIILAEHGVGYSYANAHRAYAGGPGRERVSLFLNANERVARLNERAYPRAQHALVGSPRLDVLATIPVTPTTVTFSWHWDCRVNPETRTAWAHYKRHLGGLVGEFAGHAHPRAWSLVSPTYARLGWPIQRTFEEVVARAAVYVCDTSSTIYEMAALGRPVVVLNAPWYRREVTHGLRFWEDIPGETVDNPKDLQGAIDRALHDDTYAKRRLEICAKLYPYRGEAAKRAADAILALYA